MATDEAVTGAPAADPATDPATGPATGPASGRAAGPAPRRRPVLLAAAAGVVLVAAAGLLTAVATGRGDDPADPVRRYLTALAAGHADTALALGVAPPSRTFLDDTALRAQAAVARVGDVHVGAADVAGDRARVTARYRVGARSVAADYDLVRRGGRWLLAAVARPVDVAAAVVAVPGLTLFGRPVAGTGRVWVFPGPLVWGSTAPWLTVAPAAAATAVSPTAAAPPVTLTPTLSPAGRDAVQGAVRAWFAGCAGSTSLRPPGCPAAETDPTGVEGTARWTAPADTTGLALDLARPATSVWVSGTSTWAVTYTRRVGTGTTSRTDAAVPGPVYGTVDLAASPPSFHAG